MISDDRLAGALRALLCQDAGFYVGLAGLVEIGQLENLNYWVESRDHEGNVLWEWDDLPLDEAIACFLRVRHERLLGFDLEVDANPDAGHIGPRDEPVSPTPSIRKGTPMAENITLERDDDAYWHLAKAFMRVLMVEANDALKDSGVNNAALRKNVAERLGAGLGNFFDQYWFEADGTRYYPVLCFAERSPASGDDLGTVQGPAPGVELHAMASDEAAWYFEEQNENDDSVPMGYD